jgi:hypothetical protein
MGRARWTYEVPLAGAGSAGLEEYVVEAGLGEPVGKVLTVLERGDRVYLVVERGLPPLRHDLRAVPWTDVESVDHAGLTVRLGLTGEALAEALQLDPEKGVEGGRAEAVRALPPWPTGTSPDVPGAVDRAGPYTTMFAPAAVGLMVLLGLVLLGSSTDFTWEYALFLVPVALFLASLASGYRLMRRPYEGVKDENGRR